MRKKTRPRTVRQGQIYYVDLKESDGARQGGRRPLLVFSSNAYNRSSPTVLMLAITSQLKRKDMKVHTLLPDIKGLPKRSMTTAEQHFTIDKSRLEDYCCKLPWKDWIKVHRSIRFSEMTKKNDYEALDNEEFVTYDGGHNEI